jgi:DNA-binding IclR family transcriptional regulator
VAQGNAQHPSSSALDCHSFAEFTTQQLSPPSYPSSVVKSKNRTAFFLTERVNFRPNTYPMPSQSSPTDSGVAVIDRAAAILGAFSSGQPRLTLAELAASTGLYKSTLLRLTAALAAHGYLLRDEDGRYAIGPAVLALARAHQGSHNPGEVLQPIMRRLVTRFREGCSFYVLREDQRVCLYRVDGPHAIREHVNVGDVLPLGKGSGGRVLAAFSGARGQVIARVRAQHCHLSLGERDPDIAGISAPVFQAGQQLVGALTLAGPRYRLNEAALRRMRIPLLEAAAEATRMLGGDPAPLLAALRQRPPSDKPATQRKASR